MDKIRDFYQKEDRLDRLRSQITEERVIEFLKPNVVIKEVEAAKVLVPSRAELWNAGLYSTMVKGGKANALF